LDDKDYGTWRQNAASAAMIPKKAGGISEDIPPSWRRIHQQLHRLLADAQWNAKHQ
jgi:hypothetical protein